MILAGIIKWVEKAKADGAQKIIYVTPSISQIPKKSQAAMDIVKKTFDLSTIEIPFK